MQRAIDKIEPYQRAIVKAHLAAAGIDIDALDTKPLIAVANSWNEVCPGHEPLRQLADEVKKGILEAGGQPIEFNTIAMCDGIAQGHLGMRYCLPHREIIADSLEAMILGEGIFDGVVFLGSCDKIVPAMLNAAARIDLPSILVTAGPCYAEIKPSESKALRQQFLRNEITERQLIEGTLRYYTGPGICPFLGTANTMGCLAEGLGMMLPGGALLPASTSMRRFHARASGRALMRLVEEQITARTVMTCKALHNAVVLLSAIGGSLNAMLHLPALAAELGLTLTWDDIAEITGKTPVVTAIVPNGDQTVIDLYKAGGIPAVLKEVEQLLCDTLTVTGKRLSENLAKVSFGDRSVIYPCDAPIMKADGIQVLYGNLAPEGAIVKTSAVPADMRVFEGPARVFDSEEACHKAFHDRQIQPGDAVVVRYEGPKGGPGMRELHRVTEVLKGIPGTAVLTDGRFSGASGGLSIGYICPEASELGPISLIRDGDMIKVDIASGLLHLDVSNEELEKRAEERSIDQKSGLTATLKRYAKTVNSAREGATLNCE